MEYRDKIIIEDLHLQVVIGAHAPERNIEQNLFFTITLFVDISKCGESDNVADTIDYVHVTKAVANYAKKAHHFTIEALAVGIARICCLGFGVQEVIVKIAKPGAIKLAKAPAVEITRSKQHFTKVDPLRHPPALLEPPSGNIVVPPVQYHYAYLALGCNLGDRVKTITDVLDTLRTHGRVIRTAHLYETPPAYVIDQPAFLNTVCLFETTLSPEDLLKLIQEIEVKFGRQRTVRYGPRTIDLDILFYDDATLINTPELVLPHPLMQDRDFVLGPLLDIAPDFVHPTLHLTIRQLYGNLRHSHSLLPPPPLAHHHTPTLTRVTPIRDLLWHPESKTYIAGILNVTPDSFSDGGNFLDVAKAVAHAIELVEKGADIIDIGGQTTKPGAELVSTEEELARVIPVIKAFREKNSKTPISIDTLSSQVAEQALSAGADMINDVTGGTHDPLILSVAAKFRVPIVLMHSVPTPQYNTLREQTPGKPVPPFVPALSSTTTPTTPSTNSTNTPTVTAINTRPLAYDLMRDLNTFFTKRAAAAAQAGINRWQIILDPGLGFAKTFAQSREILRRGGELATLGYSTLIGPSRKKFIADSLSIPEDSPLGNERKLGSLACCSAAVSWGVSIVRVHDVAEALYTVRMADAIHKPQTEG